MLQFLIASFCHWLCAVMFLSLLIRSRYFLLLLLLCLFLPKSNQDSFQGGCKNHMELYLKHNFRTDWVHDKLSDSHGCTNNMQNRIIQICIIKSINYNYKFSHIIRIGAYISDWVRLIIKIILTSVQTYL